jgi:threonine aldolase
MGNQLALRAHAAPGDEVILETDAHVANHESAAASALSGLQLRFVKGDGGIMDPDDIERAIRRGYYWEPNPRLICLENTHNQAGGIVYPHEMVVRTAEVARKHNLSFHLDGARLWNASVASGLTPSECAEPFDSVSVCLSKGLGAPVGSVVAGSTAFIKKVHRFRKMYGGGMRQIGILAAAGLYALDNHIDELARDHTNAKRLASALSELDSFIIDPELVQTNIIVFNVAENLDVDSVLERMKSVGILMIPFGPKTIRAVTHRDIPDEAINRVIERLEELF